MKPMKIILSIAPWDLLDNKEDSHLPMGQAYLGAVLEKEGYDVEFMDLNAFKWDDVKNDVKNKIKKDKPDIFGVTILSNSRVSALQLLNLVKEVSPKTTILAGGVHTTFLYYQILDNYPVDFAVIGEGEITLIELINAIKNKKSVAYFKKIKGIAFIHKGEIIKTESRPRNIDLDSLPFPKHDFFEDFILRKNTAYIVSSRGCPYSCSFCPSSAFWGRFLAQRSAKNIFSEIKYLLKKYPNIHTIKFLDDEFLVNNGKIIELCKMIIKDDIKLNFTCAGRVTSINERVLKWLKKAGVSYISFGVESGSQMILDKMGKKVKINQIVRCFELCAKYNIYASFLAIVGSPGENSMTVNDTIRLAIKLDKPVEPAILIIYPGTEVYRLAKEKNLLNDDYWLSDGLCPLYTCENSNFKLLWWSFKVGFVTNFFSSEGHFFDFLNRKLFDKLKPKGFTRVFKRYITDKV